MSLKDYQDIHGKTISAPQFLSDGKAVTGGESSEDYGRARKAGFICSAKTRAEVLYQAEGRCYICGVEEWRTKRLLHMHRVIPGDAGGVYTPDNIVPLCARCHYHAEGRPWGQINAMRAAGGVK